jgi:predicted extracellular nuclease
MEQPLQSRVPQAPDLSEPGDRLIRVVSMNLLNFFNGDGAGGDFPTERGPKSYDDFLAQARRIQSALAVMQPTLIGVQELENDGFGEFSAAQSLLDLLNESVPGRWSVVQTQSGKIGKHDISIGLFYRKDILEAVGPSHVLDSLPFRGLSRQPLAQLFRERSSGAEFLVAANHFKSKGSCPDSGVNSNQDDGQGCWNAARVAAAESLITWLGDLARNAGTSNALILGDMNSYRQEDPIRTFRKAEYRDLVEYVLGLPQYSYVFWGQAGTLDYAFSTEALLPFVRTAEFWHINADWPQKVELPQPWLRFSDHDPIVVDLDFSQAATSD